MLLHSASRYCFPGVSHSECRGFERQRPRRKFGGRLSVQRHQNGCRRKANDPAEACEGPTRIQAEPTRTASAALLSDTERSTPGEHWACFLARLEPTKLSPSDVPHGTRRVATPVELRIEPRWVSEILLRIPPACHCLYAAQDRHHAMVASCPLHQSRSLQASATIPQWGHAQTCRRVPRLLQVFANARSASSS